MDDKEIHSQTIDTLLERAAHEPVDVPEHLFARVLNDASAEQDRIARARSQPRPKLWIELTEVFGNWFGLGSLAAACCTGFWIGISPPDGIGDAADFLFGDGYYSILNDSGNITGFGWDLEEG